MVEGRRVDGLVVIRTRREDERIAYLAERGFPFVAFGRTNLTLDYPCIDEDGQAGTYELVAYLASLGHERIAYIAAPQDLMFGFYRREGYRQAIKDAGLPYDEQLVVMGDLTRRGGAAVTEQLLLNGATPTAIVAANDLMALGAMNVAQEHGLVVGGDLSIAGFDDIPTAEALSLTTLHQPIYDIGHQLSRMLARVIAGDELEDQRVLLKPELVVRSSTAPPARN
jgi:LacI family transcriptional regulator